MPRIAFFYDILREDEKLLLARLRERASVDAIHASRVVMAIGSGGPDADLGVVRGVSFSTSLYSALVAESWGLHVVNSAESLVKSRDKVWSLSIFSRVGIPFPESLVSMSPESLTEASGRLGYPVVVKPVRGSWGRLVSLARDEEEARMIAEHRAYMGENYRVGLVQRLVEKPGRDLRVFCVGGEVPAGIYRVGSHWITNIARGARAEPLKPSPEVEDLALRACRALGVEVGGVDIVEDPSRGYLVLEVNAVPEFKTTIKVTGVDLASIIADYLVGRARR